jgi:TPP-dependent trihydroxycyclohexane-1,2-dione (THcHDO) dehydratase
VESRLAYAAERIFADVSARRRRMLASMSEIDPCNTALVNWSDLGVSGLLPMTLLLADVESAPCAC